MAILCDRLFARNPLRPSAAGFPPVPPVHYSATAPHPLMTNRVFVSHGVSIGVRADDPELLDRASQCFPPGWEPSASASPDAWYSLVRSAEADGARTRYALFQNDEKLDEGYRVTRLLESMDRAIRVQVGRRAPERLFVHAGAVAWKHRCIVLPGRSGWGKTTLVAALVRAGAIYCSDEYAVLDAEGLVHPYARDLSFRQGAHRRVRRNAAADFGGQDATQPLPVGLVVHTRYIAGAGWAPRVINPGQSALALFGNVLVARERPAFAFSVLSRAVSGVVSLQTDRGEAAAAAAAILAYADHLHASSRGQPT